MPLSLALKKISGLFIFCSCTLQVIAQDFIIEYPKKKDDFVYDFLNVLNDAPFKFLHVKGKPLPGLDSSHPRSKVFQTKIMLPASVTGKIVQDSSIYAEYLFGDFKDMDDAEGALLNLTTKISKALYKKVLVRNSEVGMDTNTLKQTKIAYCWHGGFFHYNIVLQINAVAGKELYRLRMKIESGKPLYYNRIMRSEPIGSFVLVNSLKNNLYSLQNSSSPGGCPNDIPAFICTGTAMVNDTIMVRYIKKGFDNFADARSEFDANMTNIRTSLGPEYVYYLLPVKSPAYRRIAFINSDDVEKTKRKTVMLTLIDQSRVDVLTNMVKKGYALELAFSY